MRIIIFAFCFVFISALCHATEMCARNDTVVIPLDANVIEFGSRGTNSNEHVWYVVLDGRRISGEGTCLSEAEGGKPNAGMGTMLNIDNKNPSELGVVAGLQGVDVYGNERKYCWCRMTHPFKTRWMYHSSVQDECTRLFANNYYGVSQVKKWLNILFKSVGIK